MFIAKDYTKKTHPLPVRVKGMRYKNVSFESIVIF